MSYNNYSYYNGPHAPNEWWGAKDQQKQPYEVERIPMVNKPPVNTPMYQVPIYNQANVPGYAKPIVVIPEVRPADPVKSRCEVFQGTVTQLFSNFGYINDNIIFSKSDVMGQMVQIGDRVAVDATLQPNNPTKYKGERVCKIDGDRFNSTSNNKTTTVSPSARVEIPLVNLPKTTPPKIQTPPKNKPVDPPVVVEIIDITTSNSPTSKTDHKIDKPSSKKKKNIRPVEKKDTPTKRSSESRHSKSKERRRSTSKDRSSSDTDKSRHSVDRASKKSKTSSSLSRKVEVPKRKAISPFKIQKIQKETPITPKVKETSSASSKNVENFSYRELDCAILKSHYRSLFVPPELFHVSLKFQQSFPLNQPMKLGNGCHFTVLDKRVRSPDPLLHALLGREIESSDAESTFVVKVMLMSTEELPKLYKDTLTFAEELEEAGGGGKLPITKAVKFLVGSLGKDREFGIGGAWSPSEDGQDPETNPRVLINTAIRTVKAATGIDLSGCSSWPKFLELRYYRPLKKLATKGGKDQSSEMEVDVPAGEDSALYREPRMETVVYFVPDVWNCMPDMDAWHDRKRMYQEQLACIMCPPPIMCPPRTPVATASPAEEEKPPEATQEEEEDYGVVEVDDGNDAPKNTEEEKPTHYSKLVVAGMKIVDIKKELEMRKLNNRGVMEQLKARLKAALEREEAEEKSKAVPAKAIAATSSQEASSTTLSEDQKTELKKLYSLPDDPHIIVHQNSKSYSQDMKFRTMSLHSLLSYYDVKLDEPTFELALFAKQFLDMLRRDAVFNIYKSIVVAPETDLASVDESSSKKQKLMVTTSKRTVNRPLLFSCTLIDRERRGRIPVEDLRVLIEGLGICLSTSQLAAVLGKVKDTSRHLMYRQLTDREVTDADMAALLRAGASEDLDYLRELALGNKALFEEEAATGTADSPDGEEVGRLRRDLDRSERSRQSLELRVAQISEEAERGARAAEAQSKVVEGLRGQLAESKAKCKKEAERARRAREDLDSLLRRLRSIDRLAASLKGEVAASLARVKPGGKRAAVSMEAVELVAKEAAEEVIKETVEVSQIVEQDFDLSTPSDFDLVVLDEAE